jgi:ATP-dependent protease ClpP protease subunit
MISHNFDVGRASVHLRNWVAILACLGPLALMTNLGTAGEIAGRVVCNQTTKYCVIKGLAIEGEISDATTVELSRLLESFLRQKDPSIPANDLSGTTVNLSSPGGSVSAAMAIGRLLRANRITAFVDPGSSCLSACVLIYAGAVRRLGYDKAARIGIHQPYFPVPGHKIDADAVRKNYSSMLADLRVYLREMNVSERLADEVMKTPPSAVRFLTAEEQEELGLSTIDPVERETSALVEAQNLGLDRNELNQREARAMQVCPPNPNFFSCYDRIMKAKTTDLPDFSKFGTPLE